MSAKGQYIQLRILQNKVAGVLKQIEKIEKREQNEYLNKPVPAVGRRARFIASKHIADCKNFVVISNEYLDRALLSMKEARDEQQTGG